MKIDPQIRHLTKPGANLFLERKLLQHRPLLARARAIGEPGMGRPTGKRTDPAFRQVSAWLRKDFYGKVRATNR